jgi:hypothetical protein
LRQFSLPICSLFFALVILSFLTLWLFMSPIFVLVKFLKLSLWYFIIGTLFNL